MDEELNVSEYQNIAREFGYAETSFVQFLKEKQILKVRSFTPGGFEVNGAGHNLLGVVCLSLMQFPEIAAALTKNEVVTMKDELIPLSIKLNSNNLPVVGMLQQSAQIIGPVPAEIISRAVNLNTDDINFKNRQPLIVKTEVTHLMVPVKDREILNNAVGDKVLLSQLARTHGFEGCYLFYINHSNGVVETRFFNPGIGIEEDAGTGSAAGPLAGMLNLQGYLKIGEEIKIKQGEKMQQPSEIFVCVESHGIWEGSSILMMEGHIYI